MSPGQGVLSRLLRPAPIRTEGGHRLGLVHVGRRRLQRVLPHRAEGQPPLLHRQGQPLPVGPEQHRPRHRAVRHLVPQPLQGQGEGRGALRRRQPPGGAPLPHPAGGPGAVRPGQQVPLPHGGGGAASVQPPVEAAALPVGQVDVHPVPLLPNEQGGGQVVVPPHPGPAPGAVPVVELNLAAGQGRAAPGDPGQRTGQRPAPAAHRHRAQTAQPQSQLIQLLSQLSPTLHPAYLLNPGDHPFSSSLPHPGPDYTPPTPPGAGG